MDAFDLQTLKSLTHHRWGLLVIAVLHRHNGSTFVRICRELGATQAAIRQTLDWLMAEGWVRRNPGYGHPLRPEYILTDDGKAVAPFCLKIESWVTESPIDGSALRKWSLVALFWVCRGSVRFSELRHHIRGVTDRALSQTLRGLVEDGVLERTLVEGNPPSTRYSLPAPHQERLQEAFALL